MNYLTGYSASIVDKVTRLSDILIKVGQIQFLKERLSLCGGTAINLVRVKKIPRLSVDIDFNYREPNSVDWGQERDMIDDTEETCQNRWFSIMKYGSYRTSFIYDSSAVVDKIWGYNCRCS